MNEGFSFTKAIADKFDVAGMFGIENVDDYDLGPIITRHLTPNLTVYNKRINEQVSYELWVLWLPLCVLIFPLFKANIKLDELVGPAIGKPLEIACVWLLLLININSL